MFQSKTKPYIFLLPALIFLATFIYWPLVKNIEYSLFHINTISNIKDFVGIDNYKEMFQDRIFYLALKNNILYMIISIIVQVGGGLVVAAILQDKIISKFSTFFRTVIFLPVLISTTVIALLFTFIYSPEGMLNQVLDVIGLGDFATGWLGNSKTSIFAVIGLSQWQNVGYIMILFIVAMQKIPISLYEAADLDGASKIQMFFNITIPMVKETFLVALVITLSGAFLVFNEIYVLTSGGPGDSSTVLGMYLFKKAFIFDDMGFASAIANFIFVLTMLIAIIQMKAFGTGKE